MGANAQMSTWLSSDRPTTVAAVVVAAVPLSADVIRSADVQLDGLGASRSIVARPGNYLFATLTAKITVIYRAGQCFWLRYKLAERRRRLLLSNSSQWRGGAEGGVIVRANGGGGGRSDERRPPAALVNRCLRPKTLLIEPHGAVFFRCEIWPPFCVQNIRLSIYRLLCFVHALGLYLWGAQLEEMTSSSSTLRPPSEAAATTRPSSDLSDCWRGLPMFLHFLAQNFFEIMGINPKKISLNRKSGFWEGADECMLPGRQSIFDLNYSSGTVALIEKHRILLLLFSLQLLSLL